VLGCRVSRDVEQTAALFSIQSDVKTLSVDMSNVKTFVNTMNMVGSSIGSSLNRLDGLVQNAADNKASLAAQKKALDEKIADLKTNVAVSLEDTTDTLTEKLAAMTAASAELKAQVAADAVKQTNTLNKMVTDKTTEMDAKLTKLETAIKSKKKGPLAIFVGGKLGGHKRSGWHDFVPDRIDYDSGAPYFKREGKGFKIMKKGTYELYVRVLTHGGWCHHHIAIYIDNQQVQDNTHHYVPGTWQQMQTHETYTMKAGSDIRVRIYGCNYAWHGSSQNARGAYNRMTFQYIGQVSDSCTGPFCTTWKK
jgi:hypothetical protein